jgi:ubiquinone/menaquinone biosynthesis C-methylase UbiE
MQAGERGRLSAQEQFGRQAQFYGDSAVHRAGESLQVVEEWTALDRHGRAVDVGTGAGFTAFALAPYAQDVVATDITPAMLKEARGIAAQRGLINVRYCLAAAETLPFGSGTLDLVTSRTAAHHFQDIPGAVAEWRRVLAPGGVLILADTISPDDPETDRWMHDIEVRRDTSHVRDLTSSEWFALLDDHGFSVTDSALTPVDLEFDDWARRSGTPTSEVEQLRQDFLDAPLGAVSAFNIKPDGTGAIHFHWDCLVLRAVLKA